MVVLNMSVVREQRIIRVVLVNLVVAPVDDLCVVLPQLGIGIVRRARRGEENSDAERLGTSTTSMCVCPCSKDRTGKKKQKKLKEI